VEKNYPQQFSFRTIFNRLISIFLRVGRQNLITGNPNPFLIHLVRKREITMIKIAYLFCYLLFVVTLLYSVVSKRFGDVLVTYLSTFYFWNSVIECTCNTMYVQYIVYSPVIRWVGISERIMRGKIDSWNWEEPRIESSRPCLIKC
jgi:hypothetical protein